MCSLDPVIDAEALAVESRGIGVLPVSLPRADEPARVICFSVPGRAVGKGRAGVPFRRGYKFAATQQSAVLKALRENGPMSPEQIADALGMQAYAVRKRLPELQREFLACPTGQMVPTRAGRLQRVWAAL